MSTSVIRPGVCAFTFLLIPCLPALAQTPPSAVPTSLPPHLPEIRYHLTARPWAPVNVAKEELLKQLDEAVHALAPLQYWNEKDAGDIKNGAIIDRYDNKEVQYATPLFSFNVATLLSFGRAADLVTPGARALDRATRDIAQGKATDHHGEFFAAAMVKALRMYESMKDKYPTVITDERLKTWKSRMGAKRNAYMNMNVKQNWRTFAMKGEWLRHQDGYISDGVQWIEANWLKEGEGGQRERFRADLDKYGMNPHFFLYHDRGADPETFAYNGATCANLLDMLENGYDGASAAEMREILEHSLTSSLLLMGASGEAPAGGRTGEHIWDDTVYAVGFEMMAEISQRKGDLRRAGQFRRAAQLLYLSHARFQQERGWFSVTKNGFHSSLKHRYASWSALTNYNGYTLTCLAEAILAQKTEIPQQPAPVEIGGYVARLDPSFSNVFANAGGMQAQICTRGETDKYGGVQWHTLGITRFSRSGFDSRLGPGAGHTHPDFKDSASFAPTYLENGKWVRVSQQPKRFEGSFEPEFVHPLLVRGVFRIAPVKGQTGPSFAMRMTLTPDGALVDTECTSSDVEQFGVVWPVLEFDGRTVLATDLEGPVVSTAFPRGADAPANVVQAEDATASGGAEIANDQENHQGNGFVKLPTAGSALEWKGLNGGDGGATMIGLRYALGVRRGETARAKLIVNGEAQPDLVFLSTGAWNDWHQLQVPVNLAPGTENVVRLEAGDSGTAAIIDELRVHPAKNSAPEPDQQNFIALKSSQQIAADEPVVSGGYGDFRPVRVTNAEKGAVETFVYPRNAGDPDAEKVRASFTREGDNFSSILGRVNGTLYAGRTSAGGVGKAIDIDQDGKEDVTFGETCGFVLQLRNGRIAAVETDRAVQATIAGKQHELVAYSPLILAERE